MALSVSGSLHGPVVSMGLLPEAPKVRLGQSEIFEFGIGEGRICNPLTHTPQVDPKYDVDSIAHTDANEININVHLGERTRNFRDAGTWF